MSFNVGDRVITVNYPVCEGEPDYNGRVGTISAIDSGLWYPVLVMLDQPIVYDDGSTASVLLVLFDEIEHYNG